MCMFKVEHRNKELPRTKRYTSTDRVTEIEVHRGFVQIYFGDIRALLTGLGQCRPIELSTALEIFTVQFGSH